MGLLDRLMSIGAGVARDVLRDAVRNATRSLTDSQPSRRGEGSSGGRGTSARGTSTRGAASASGSRRTSPASEAGTHSPTRTARSDSELPGASDAPVAYSVADLGMPHFEWAPRADNAAQPGEIVWTWVPFEEDASQGKDRPVLVLAEHRGRLVIAQLTSKDHDRDAAQEARDGRFWMDLGTGDWDSRGRASEVRLDRLLVVHPDRVRREGGTLDKTRFTQVVEAIKRFHS